jgi:hypothetical protein
MRVVFSRSSFIRRRSFRFCGETAKIFSFSVYGDGRAPFLVYGVKRDASLAAFVSCVKG